MGGPSCRLRVEPVSTARRDSFATRYTRLGARHPLPTRARRDATRRALRCRLPTCVRADSLSGRLQCARRGAAPSGSSHSFTSTLHYTRRTRTLCTQAYAQEGYEYSSRLSAQRATSRLDSTRLALTHKQFARAHFLLCVNSTSTSTSSSVRHRHHSAELAPHFVPFHASCRVASGWNGTERNGIEHCAPSLQLNPKQRSRAALSRRAARLSSHEEFGSVSQLKANSSRAHVSYSHSYAHSFVCVFWTDGRMDREATVRNCLDSTRLDALATVILYTIQYTVQDPRCTKLQMHRTAGCSANGPSKCRA